MRHDQHRGAASEPSSAEEDYLKAIHHLGGAERQVAPGRIAELLQVRAPSVTNMLKDLSGAGWIAYEPGQGARLTKQGVAAARRVIRRHRLVELFLTRVLGLDWSEVDGEAEALEHAVSPRVEKALAAFLGEPAEDPHGHPIPTSEGALAERPTLQPFSSFRPGQRVLIREVDDSDGNRLKKWRALGLVPGVTVLVLSFQPFEDLWRLQVASEAFSMGTAGLAGLRGELAPALEKRLAG